MEKLNKKPEISDLVPLTYSMLINNIDLSKQKNTKSEYSFLNLENLVNEFQLDTSFISKSYYQSDPEFSYNEPAKGPIDLNFECIYCKKEGPNNHLRNCKRPFNSSLYLTKEFNNFEEGTPYNLVVTKRGQKKVVSTSIKSDIFLDSVEIIYSDVNKRECVIRIAKNGSINIISAGFGNKKIINEIINKINQTSALILPEYRKVYAGKSKFEIDTTITYKYLLFAQFNMYPKEYQESYFIDLSEFNKSMKRYIQNRNSKEVLSYRTDYYYITNYEINTGNILSRSNKMTNPLINFNLIHPGMIIKFSITIYKRGAVQLRLSYNNKKAVSEKQLELSDLENVYQFLEKIFTEIIKNNNIILSDAPKLKKGITNMVDGKQPQMCHDRQGLRPEPYSFRGVCPDPNMFVRPEGKKRPDGKYEPCCYKLKDNGKDSKNRYLKILKHGYPDSEAASYDENIPNPDTKSAVYIPGTKTLESRRFKGLMDMDQNELMSCIQDSGYIREKDIFDQSEYVTLKDRILNEYSFLVGTSNLIFQHPVTLTPNTFPMFTKDIYIVTPVNSETIKVFLFFNDKGESYFINENKDVSETSLGSISELASTLIEGNLYPYKDELVFYPFDILYSKGTNLSSTPFYSTRVKNPRYSTLMYLIDKIKSVNSDLTIETPQFDLNIIGGSKNFLNNKEYGDISSLIYIPVNEGYTFNRINKKLLIWNNVNKGSNDLISLNVYHKNNNRWEVKMNSKNIPAELLPQENGTIEIPLVFSNKNSLKDNDLVLFKINILNKTDKMVNTLINTKKPLTPVEKITENITDYFSVINILQSIQTPISKINITTFKINNITYTHSLDQYGKIELNKPLSVQY